MACDCHIHYIPQEIAEHTSFYKGVWSDKEKVFSYLEANAIEKALLVYPSTDAYQKLGQKETCRLYNQKLELISKENPKIFAAGLVDTQDKAGLVEQVKELKERGFKALSLASSFQGKFLLEEIRPLFEAAGSFSLPLFVHPQTINPIGFERVKDPLIMPVLEYSFDLSVFMALLMVEGILTELPVKFIFSSLGGVIPFLRYRLDRVYAMLRARDMVKDLKDAPSEILKKVYVDTSGAPLENVKAALSLFGEDKVLWGSDYPAMTAIKENMAELNGLGAAKEKIIRQNFINLFQV